MRAVHKMGAFVLLLLGVSGTTAEVKLESTFVHTGVCEASGAVALPAGSFGTIFVVGNDEDNILRAYAADRSGDPLPLAAGDLNKPLGLDSGEDEKVDFEAATWLGGKVYWIGSHSRSRRGNLREVRWRRRGRAARPTPSRPGPTRTHSARSSTTSWTTPSSTPLPADASA